MSRNHQIVTYHITRTIVAVAFWALEMQGTMLFSPIFERVSETAEGVKLRNDHDAPLSRRLHHFGDLLLAVHLFRVVGSKPAIFTEAES